MAKRKRKRGLGEVSRNAFKVSAAARFSRGDKTLPVTVKLSRDSRGLYYGFACVKSRMKVGGATASKAKHCGGIGSTERTPKKAAATALARLARSLGAN